MADVDKEKWRLPDSLRVDLDTPESRLLLERSNATQAEWREQYGSPYLQVPATIKRRARSSIIVEEYRSMGTDTLTPQQRDEYAEALADIGNFAEAIDAADNPVLAKEFAESLEAILEDDGTDCGHGSQRKTAVREIFSLKHNAEVVLLRCSECGSVNAVPHPDFVLKARSQRADIRRQLSGLHPLEAKKRMSSKQ